MQILSPRDLYRARIENVERLASALGVEPPPRIGSETIYQQRLVGVVLAELRRDEVKTAFEQLTRF